MPAKGSYEWWCHRNTCAYDPCMCPNFDSVEPKPPPPRMTVHDYAGVLFAGKWGSIETVHAWPKRDAWTIRFDQDAQDWRFDSWRWSLVPFWSKERNPKISTFNARSETVYKAPVFRGPWRLGQRCLIPLTGWYESAKPLGRKGRVRIQPSTPEITFAGLWDAWTDKDTGEFQHSFTMLTTSPAPSIVHVHNRMPVIIPERYRDAWLDPSTTTEAALRMLHPVEDCYQVQQ